MDAQLCGRCTVVGAKHPRPWRSSRVNIVSRWSPSATHCVARDRQARDRAGGTAAGAKAFEDRRIRGWRFGLLRRRLRATGTARPRRHAARKSLDRGEAAGPTGRAGQARSEINRRRLICWADGRNVNIEHCWGVTPPGSERAVSAEIVRSAPAAILAASAAA
jgi:hypothetical protein